MNWQPFYSSRDFDRAAQRRADAAWQAALRHDATVVAVPLWRLRSLIALPEPAAILPSLSKTIADLDDSLVIEQHYYLGELEGRQFVALDLSLLPESAAQAWAHRTGGAFVELRDIGTKLPRDIAAILAYARGLLYWHDRHRFCGVCGSPTIAVQAGHHRSCTNPDCSATHFPRTDPAIITLVSDGPRCLLGRQARWAKGRFSTLAGFVEPGESLEDAVRREVREESGIELAAVRYQASQPWPFPASLMLGFQAEAATDEIRVDGQEIEEAYWFTAADIQDFGNRGLSLPPPDSISRQLIETWLKTQDRADD